MVMNAVSDGKGDDMTWEMVTGLGWPRIETGGGRL